MPEAHEILHTLLDAVVCFTPAREVVALNDAASRLWLEGAHPPGAALAPRSSPQLERILEQLPLPTMQDGQAYRYLKLETEAGPSWVEALILRRDAPTGTFFVLVVPEPQFQSRLRSSFSTSRKQLALGALAGGLQREFQHAFTNMTAALDAALAAGSLPRDVEDGLTQAKSGAQRTAQLLQAVGTLTRPPKSAQGPVEVRPILDQAVTVLRRCLDPAIRLEAPLTTTQLWFVQAHAGDLMELIVQSALNAQHAMKNGGEISLTAANVVAAPAQKKGEFVRLTLLATPERSAPESTRETSWVGGTDPNWIHSLPALPRLLEDLQATTELEPQGAHTTAVHFLFPRSAALASGPATTRPARAGQAEGSERIMLADDEELVRMVIRTILSHRGYQVTEAENGEDAVEKYLQNPTGFDLILIDMNMPKLNGRNALLQMRQQNPHQRAIILSGGVDEQEGEASHLEGVVFLRKPFDNQELLRTVRSSLDVRAKS